MKDSNRQQLSHLSSFMNTEAVMWNPPAIFHTWPETSAKWRNLWFLSSRPTIKWTTAITQTNSLTHENFHASLAFIRCADGCKHLNTCCPLLLVFNISILHMLRLNLAVLWASFSVVLVRKQSNNRKHKIRTWWCFVYQESSVDQSSCWSCVPV